MKNLITIFIKNSFTSCDLISDLKDSLLSLTKACGLSLSSALANKPTVCNDESIKPMASKPIFGPKSDLN